MSQFPMSTRTNQCTPSYSPSVPSRKNSRIYLISFSLLTVGMGTISHDDRFYVSHSRLTQNWELHIKFVRQKDKGEYECQISTHPPSSIFVTLRIVEARAEILGEPDKHVRSGSTFELICVMRESTEPPVFVFWYHNERMINYDKVRGVIVNSDTEKSVLIIEDAQKTDSGNYSCVPSNARPTSITVHILNGEKPAAMQHGSLNHSIKSTNSSGWILFLGLSSSLLVVISLHYCSSESSNFNTTCTVSSSSPSSSSRTLSTSLVRQQRQFLKTHEYLPNYLTPSSLSSSTSTTETTGKSSCNISCSSLVLRPFPATATPTVQLISSR